MQGKDLVQDKYLNMMLIGASGSGKTHLVGEGLKYGWMQPAYFFDTDLRLQSLLSRFGPEVLDHIEYDQFRDLSNAFGGAFAKAQSKKMELARLVCKGGPDAPKSIIVDSGTFLAKLIINEALKLDGKSMDASPGLNHYGTLATKMERFVSEFTGLPCHFILTVHENVIKDDVTGALQWGIALTKYLRNTLPGYFNEVYQCKVKTMGSKATYEVHPRPIGGYPSRTCIQTLDGTETHQELWRKINEDKEINGIVSLATNKLTAFVAAKT